LVAGSFVYTDVNCTECRAPRPGCFDTGTGQFTLWDADHNNSSIHTWDLKFCGLFKCADCSFSDERLKTGIRTISNSLESLLNIQVTEYDWNEKYSGYDFLKERQKLHSIGMIAQDIQKIFPEVVYKRSDGYYAIKYFKLNALIIESIKSHQVFIDDIDEQIKWLKTQIN